MKDVLSGLLQGRRVRGTVTGLVFTESGAVRISTREPDGTARTVVIWLDDLTPAQRGLLASIRQNVTPPIPFELEER